MFGRHYFGGAYYGARYWGDGGDTAPPGATAAQIWAYILPNGLSAGATLAAIWEALQPDADPMLKVNVKKVNDVNVKGTGVPGDTWGPE
ncbi:hypothetical protein [Caudoviricetes sp.]|nr:hypothetical protein [Caudoviricetes sp.]